MPPSFRPIGTTASTIYTPYVVADNPHGLQYSNGYVGLLPKTGSRGNRKPRLPEASRNLLIEFVTNDFESLKQKTRAASWAALKRACEERAIVAPSYVSFCLAVRERPAFDQTLKRQGRRAAYNRTEFYFELQPTTPRHGDRPFEIGHIDHTELDGEVVCSLTGRPLGRPWLTILTDAFSRRGLSVYPLTYDLSSSNFLTDPTGGRMTVAVMPGAFHAVLRKTHQSPSTQRARTGLRPFITVVTVAVAHTIWGIERASRAARLLSQM